MDFPRGCYCVTCQAMQYWKLMSWKAWSFLIGKRGIFTNVYWTLLPHCEGFKNHFSWASWTLKMEAANCSEKSTIICLVYGVIFLKTLLLVRISVRTLNFLMQSFLFYMVLGHETTDFCTMGITVCTTILTKKNSCRKVLKRLGLRTELILKWV
jgi:hypothetical protein